MASDLGIVCGLTLPLGASAMMSTCRTCGYRRHPSREGSPRRKVGTHVNSFANLMTKPPAARVVAPPPPASIAVSDLEAGSCPSQGRVGRNTCDASRSAGEETPIARGFRAQHSRGGGVVVEEQTTGDGRRNHFRQHIGCREIGFGHCRGRRSVASLDAGSHCETTTASASERG